MNDMTALINSMQIIDLTHNLNSTVPTWDGSCGFEHSIKTDYDDAKGEVKFRVNDIAMRAGAGTHMDAPAHCIQGRAFIADVPLNQLITHCIMIDIHAKVNETYSLTVEDIKNFEQQYGEVPHNSFVIIYTGWSRHWPNKDRYHNNHFFPSVSIQAAEYLIDRSIAGIGIDTLSPDRPQDGFVVHQLMLSQDKYIVENVANADKLPAIGAISIALPPKFEECTEAPIRLVALCPKSSLLAS